MAEEWAVAAMAEEWEAAASAEEWAAAATAEAVLAVAAMEEEPAVGAKSLLGNQAGRTRDCWRTILTYMSSTLRTKCKSTGVAVLVLSLCFALTTCGSVMAKSAGVTLNVNDVPLYQVVLLLTQQSGINIIVDQEKAQKRITAQLEGLPLEKVLDYVVTSAGVSIYKKDDGTYVIGGEEPAPKAAEPAHDVQYFQQPLVQTAPVQRARVLRTEIVKLVHSSPSDILRILNIESGPIQNKPITTAPGGNMEEQYPWKPTTPVEPRYHAPAGGLIMGPDDVIPPLSDNPDRRAIGAGRTASEDTGAGQRPPSTYSSGRPGQVPTTPGATRGAPGTAAPVPAATSSGTLLPEGIDLVMAYDIDNSIIVRGDDIGIAEFKDLLHLVDIPPKQVEIKAEFVEVASTAIRSFGIDWNLERLNFAFDTNFAPAGDVLIGIATGNLSADIRAQLRDVGARVVNAPIVSTLNNTPATIEIGKQIPFFQGVVQNTGLGNTIQSTQLIEIPVTTYLFVLPRVNGDGSITMFLEPSVQDTAAVYTAPDGTIFPERTFQRIRTNRRVMNGETIVVGGIIRKADRSEEKRVPVLSDLPIIGGLFRSKSTSIEDRELLIFLTPRIIPDRSGGSIGIP
jgi:general secretion pathway protein D